VNPFSGSLACGRCLRYGAPSGVSDRLSQFMARCMRVLFSESIGSLCLDSGDPAHVRSGPRPLSDLLGLCHSISIVGWPSVLWPLDLESDTRVATTRPCTYSPRRALPVVRRRKSQQSAQDMVLSATKQHAASLTSPFHTGQSSRCIDSLLSTSSYAPAFIPHLPLRHLRHVIFFQLP